MAFLSSRSLTTLRLLNASLTVVLLSMLLSLSACGTASAAQQQATLARTRFTQLFNQAQQGGVPASALRPVLQQQQQLSATQPPLTFFNTQPLNQYYQNLDMRYAHLQLQLQSIFATTTERTQNQAQQDLQTLQLLLDQRHAQKLPVQNFTQQLQQSQTAFLIARTPSAFAHVSTQVSVSTHALNMLPAVSQQLTQLQTMSSQMQNAHIDVTWLQPQIQSDQNLFMTAQNSSDLQHIQTLINDEYQQAVVHTTQALPIVTASKLQELQSRLTFLKTYGVNTSAYQSRVNADQARMSQVKTIQDYTAFSKQVDADINAMQEDAVPAEARALVQQFDQEALHWGQAHLYHDNFDGKDYPLDAGYMSQGIGSDLDYALSQAVTTDDFQGVVNLANDDLFNLHLFESDYADKTDFSQPHQTDQQALQHYDLLKRQVIVISLANQAMRIYQNGQLVRALQITSGRPELPSLPGNWSVLSRLSPTTFTSSEPPGSPYWYPPTPIHYAIMYHQGGYFIHDSWWRADYGPGTQFPHLDSSGNQDFSGDGSHGCVNVPLDQAGWIYQNTDWNTAIVIY
jgi:L,D-transpeptidase catalytic domain